MTSKSRPWAHHVKNMRKASVHRDSPDSNTWALLRYQVRSRCKPLYIYAKQEDIPPCPSPQHKKVCKNAYNTLIRCPLLTDYMSFVKSHTELYKTIMYLRLLLRHNRQVGFILLVGSSLRLNLLTFSPVQHTLMNIICACPHWLTTCNLWTNMPGDMFPMANVRNFAPILNIRATSTPHGNHAMAGPKCASV